MRFEDLDSKMRVYEEAHDFCVLPEMYMVARLDGRGFAKLTKEMKFEKPFDDTFSMYMRDVVDYLMHNSGFHIIYGYTQSDEISLLLKLDENTFKRKVRKLNTTLAGLASAVMTNRMHSIVSFDCRISQLPTKELVRDYFSWRQEDANRNALSGYAYWTLREAGMSGTKAASVLNGMGKAAKNELLFEYGINYNDVTEWHKRGVGFYFQTVIKEGYNPKTQQKVQVERNRLVENEVLPIKEDYRYFIKRLLDV